MRHFIMNVYLLISFKFLDKEKWSIYATLNTIIPFLAMIFTKQKINLEISNLQKEEERIKDLKHKLKLASPPELCYAPVPEGKSGNMKLHRNCVYCPHKYVCHKDANNGEGLRTFKYSRGLVHFTKIKKEPKVDEIYEQKAG